MFSTQERKLNTNNASSSTPPSRATTSPKSMTTASTPSRCQRSMRSLKHRPSIVTPVPWAPGMPVTEPGTSPPWGPEPLPLTKSQSEIRKIQEARSVVICPSSLPPAAAHPTLLFGDCDKLSSSAPGKLFSRNLSSSSENKHQDLESSSSTKYFHNNGQNGFTSSSN